MGRSSSQQEQGTNEEESSPDLGRSITTSTIRQSNTPKTISRDRDRDIKISFPASVTMTPKTVEFLPCLDGHHMASPDAPPYLQEHRIEQQKALRSSRASH